MIILKENILKMKYLLTVFFIVFFIVGFFLFLKQSNLEKKQEDKRSEFKTYERIINSGETFSVLANILGLNSVQASEVLAASEGVHDLARIRVGNFIRTFFNQETGDFEKLEYQISENNLLIVKNEENELVAEKEEIEYEIKITKVSGLIEGSLYQTGKKLGLTDKTIIEMADIFVWDIDFGFDVRAGDGFSLLYEKRFQDDEEVSPGKILMARYDNQEKSYWAVRYQDTEGRSDYYDLDGNCLRRQFLRAPLQYKYISSGFSYQRMHPVLNRYTQHLAIDYAAPTGTPVSTTGDGIITFVGWQGGVGKTIVVRHNEIYTTRYSHLLNYAKGMKVGAKVSQGQIIGYVGSTGHLSTGPHLEYAMTKHGRAINPLTENFENVQPIKDIYRQDFDLRKKELLGKF